MPATAIPDAPAGSRKPFYRILYVQVLFAIALGGALGVGLAYAMVRGLVEIVPATLLAGATIQMDSAVLVFAGAIAVVAAGHDRRLERMMARA